MSDKSDESMHAEQSEQSNGKPKRVLSAAQLENLKQARVKAREKKLELGALRVREKALKDKQLHDRIAALNIAEATPVKKGKRNVTHAMLESSTEPPPPSESSEEVSSDSSEEEVKPKRKANKKRVSKRPVHDDELVQQVQRDELQRRIQKATYHQTFASIFPGQPNIYV